MSPTGPCMRDTRSPAGSAVWEVAARLGDSASLKERGLLVVTPTLFLDSMHHESKQPRAPGSLELSLSLHAFLVHLFSRRLLLLAIFVPCDKATPSYHPIAFILLTSTCMYWSRVICRAQTGPPAIHEYTFPCTHIL